MSSTYGRLAAIRDYWMPRDTSARIEVRVTDLDEVLRELVRVITISAPQPAPAPPGWTDADADAARLALELECLLTDKAMPMETVSRWWDSAHEALELHLARMAAPPEAQKEATPTTQSHP
jgi:hypothetical protein